MKRLTSLFLDSPQRSCFAFLKREVAGFEALDFDHHWLVLTDR
jgi:hypothetical protein